MIIGADVRTISDDALKILSNKEVIAVNQDRLGVQGNKRSTDGDLEVWAGPLMDGSVAAVLLNRGNDTATVTAHWTDLGLHYSQVYICNYMCRLDYTGPLSLIFERAWELGYSIMCRNVSLLNVHGLSCLLTCLLAVKLSELMVPFEVFVVILL